MNKSTAYSWFHEACRRHSSSSAHAECGDLGWLGMTSDHWSSSCPQTSSLPPRRDPHSHSRLGGREYACVLQMLPCKNGILVCCWIWAEVWNKTRTEMQTRFPVPILWCGCGRGIPSSRRGRSRYTSWLRLSQVEKGSDRWCWAELSIRESNAIRGTAYIQDKFQLSLICRQHVQICGLPRKE